MPVTAHAAFDKGAQYLGVKIIHAPLAADMRVDVGAVRKLITRNTIFVRASACTSALTTVSCSSSGPRPISRTA